MSLNLLLFLLISLCFGAELEGTIDVGHAVTDMIYKKGILYVATEQGEVKFVDLKKKKVLRSIELPAIRDFMGNPIPPKVYSVDLSPSRKELLIVSQASGGFSEVYTYREGRGFEKVIDLGWNLIIKEGRYVSDDRALLALLGDEIALMDLRKKKFIYRVQVGRSSLSDIDLSEDRQKAAVSDEAGVVSLVRVSDGKVIRRFKGVNVDKLYRLDYRDGKILVGGRDRRVALYYTDGDKYRKFPARFLVFSVAMDSSARLGAYLYNEHSDVRVIELESGTEVAMLRGHTYPVSVMLFLDGKLLTGCDDGKIFIWRLER